MRVLIAEDDPIYRLALKTAVRKLGHEPHATGDGAEAWDSFCEIPADLVISDWRMPHMDGPELCRRIRADRRTAMTYFIFLSAYGDKSHLLTGIQLGADYFLTKPFDPIDIEIVLAAAARRIVERDLWYGEQEQRARLEATLQLVRTLQHELNNPLQALMGTVELHSRRLGPDCERHQDHLNRIREAARRIADFTARIAQVTRLETIPSPAGERLRLPDAATAWGSARDSNVEACQRDLGTCGES